MTIDEACMLAVIGASTGDAKAYNAAIYMMAARDPEACIAMYRSGLIADCVDSRGKSRVKADPVVSTNSGGKSAVLLTVDCRRTERGTIQPVVSAEVAAKYSREQIMGACK
jgi:hypothetical protein